MEKEVTIYDIAKILQLSPATVSRALNDHPAINSKTKLSIVTKAAELGYRSNTFASNLRRKSTSTLGVIVPRLDSSFMSAVLAGMEAVANQAGYNLLISQSLESQGKEKTNVKTMYNSRVDGLLVSVAYDTEGFEHFENFVKKNIPVLFFDRIFDHPACASIVIDNVQAGFEITSHLIEQGCRRIMHVTGNLKRNVYSGRYQGYQNALAKYGIPLDESLIMVTDLSQEAGEAAIEKLAEMDNKPDGIFIANDICAVSCVQALKKRGFKIPVDIAVAGFNNDPVSKVIEPNLTTIFYPGREMGEVAVRTMINHLKGVQKIDTTNTVILKSELIVRESTVK
ncbi:LacI family DNA-binding transcriptional regulator [Dyadobacter psychrotolerans]|uniref:LacI family transcriptional regulator n=1 Tax=Dyadobacter psychrotolerans TaxID=2541721 RepID=A0A4R5DI76_9BACT|nr:LacI family DNA-binding transcriptional regulator [Dyadobacter psychrotolerans]TDE11650.1 LacI family transcriptional regulator [Dyadobacter psychrotolerans]